MYQISEHKIPIGVQIDFYHYYFAQAISKKYKGSSYIAEIQYYMRLLI